MNTMYKRKVDILAIMYKHLICGVSDANTQSRPLFALVTFPFTITCIAEWYFIVLMNLNSAVKNAYTAANLCSFLQCKLGISRLKEEKDISRHFQRMHFILCNLPLGDMSKLSIERRYSTRVNHVHWSQYQ